MKRIHYVMMAMMIMTALTIGNAHSGSGSSGVSSVPTNNTPTVQKEKYTVSEAEYYPLADFTCGGNADISEGERFLIVSNGEAFLDRATCLIWEMNPLPQDLTLPQAENHCESLQIGNINDWRVPVLFDLMLLEDSIDGSVRPWDMANQCYNNNYGGVGEYHCKGWTNTPALEGPDGTYFTIIMNHGALAPIYPNDLAYPFCVSGVVKSGY